MTSVLVADDVAPLRILLREFLEEGGFEVVGEAGDGVRAVSMAEALQPDVVLLDVSMPRMDGLTALPKILEVAPKTRVVVLTGFLDSLVKEKAVKAGAAGFLEKGVDGKVIVETVRQVAH